MSSAQAAILLLPLAQSLKFVVFFGVSTSKMNWILQLILVQLPPNCGFDVHTDIVAQQAKNNSNISDFIFDISPAIVDQGRNICVLCPLKALK